MQNVTIVQDADDAAIAEWIIRQLRDALSKSDRKTAITVPGGSTPFPIMEILAQTPLDWGRIAIIPGDDRVVPESHPASNIGKIRAIFEPAGAIVTALDSARTPPHFALAWLGMGGDGHIASLFPNTDPQVDDPQLVRRLTPDPLPPEAPFDRVTMTIPALLNSDAVMFVIRGADKREVFDQAMRGEHDLPIARFLAAADRSVTCFA